MLEVSWVLEEHCIGHTVEQDQEAREYPNSSDRLSGMAWQVL